MADEPTVFGQEATEQIAKTVREVARRMKNETPIRGRWQNMPGIGIKHGIVTEHLGCGYYTVEKATWAGEVTQAGYGGIGVDYWTGSDSNCDVCYDITGEGTDQCGITLSYPPLQVTGSGEFVTAYDEASALIPLVVGTSCKMLYMGDTDITTAEAIWQIIRGVMTHVVEYKETWDCCLTSTPPTETLISRTPVILIGRECAAISCGTCPP